ncbi:seryl-tRNA synthetase [Tepidamorphus gemmatus]|uniref:Serine--tRNA ligase n=1 Tax=Tepidamorphus gemmatus TaxID=747076 RepID=A0A4V2UZS8_9HYPH|nr:serine--tRNA ligase [Tepidamorphus gemmatus]TCT12403.1 seryl-tRNA synthetase [Tepidamorphus gemmatus]
MHDIKWIRENPDVFDAALMRRSPDFAGTAVRLIGIDEKRRALVSELQALQERRNAASKEVGQAKAAKDEARAQALIAEVGAIKEKVPALEAEVKAVEAELYGLLAGLPNLPLDEVPDGTDEHGNVEIRRVGEPKRFDFAPKQHFEIGEALGLMDFEAAARMSGARFVVLKGMLARLERALGTFMLDIHTTEHGYTEVNPPLLVRDETMFGTAQLPKFVDDQFLATRTITRAELLHSALGYADEGDREAFARGEIDLTELVERTIEKAPLKEDFWLIPTAEVPLTNLAREQILEEDSLPMRVTAWTPCFRAEAGAAGRDTRGMIRQHQFSKVELVSITTPEQSMAELERMTESAETILKRLGLPYRVVTLCTGDMGFASRKTYDIEVWLPGQDTYREISSCSVCGDFQARRMDARYRPRDGSGVRHVHTLNGSGVAVGRALIAVLENYQQADGTVIVPEALRPYMGGLEVIRASE